MNLSKNKEENLEGEIETDSIARLYFVLNQTPTKNPIVPEKIHKEDPVFFFTQRQIQDHGWIFSLVSFLDLFFQLQSTMEITDKVFFWIRNWRLTGSVL